jgi:2-dehydro-3-deoxyphosphogluconate aldolase/(4S)-4-hydroxy-2-oxoglutarate aldolase
VNQQEVRNRIVEVGVIPALRVHSMEDALFAAQAVSCGGVPIVEVLATVPEAHKVIAHLVQNAPEVMVGAGSISDVETAHRCLDAGPSS